MKHGYYVVKNQTPVAGTGYPRRTQTDWNALSGLPHPLCKKDQDTVDAQVENKTLQLSEELIVVRNSCDVTVNTTDTKAAVNLQAALQAAIVILISISIADSNQAENITNDLMQSVKTKQVSLQKIVVEGSQNVDVTTTDTQLSVSIQILVQLLILISVQLDIL
ncbi:spore coat protein [Alteribacter populi]|uniref:spore coat protein n=1 Tax=Alteribacter populi TaxID=2011011 RepID=UPI000BBA7413|nr:spore coat protein [Alteribacter populi]